MDVSLNRMSTNFYSTSEGAHGIFRMLGLEASVSDALWKTSAILVASVP